MNTSPVAVSARSEVSLPRCTVQLEIERLAHAEGVPLPEVATSGSAGLDLRAAVDETLVIGPGERRLVPTGLVFAIPEGWEGQVRPRSGLALRHGVTVLNAPGTIDSDYRGEVSVLLINHGDQPFEVERGNRVAQLLLAPVPMVLVSEGVVTRETERGSGGYGSTGSR